MVMTLAMDKVLLSGRVLAAAVGGYALSVVICLLLGQAMELTDREAQTFNSMVFFLVYLVLVIVMFSISSHKKAILGMIIANGVVWEIWYALGGAL